MVDRQPAAALETSFANGGQISASYAEPWANPGAPLKILQVAGPATTRRCCSVRGRLAAMALGPAVPDRVPAVAHAAQHDPVPESRAVLARLPEAAARRDRHRVRPARARHPAVLHRRRRNSSTASRPPTLMRAIRLRSRREDRRRMRGDRAGARARAATASPAASTRRPTSRATRSEFTAELARLAAARGVRFAGGTDVERARWPAAMRSTRRARASNERRVARRSPPTRYVVALGSYSPLLLAPLGVPCIVYPAKGYSATIDIGEHRGAPTVSLTDLACKIVITRLGDRLRVAGTAELTGYDTRLEPRALRGARAARRSSCSPMPAIATSAQYWAGLRPATPSNVPLIGRTRYRNLYLDTGHGTLGWTMACGSGARAGRRRRRAQARRRFRVHDAGVTRVARARLHFDDASTVLVAGAARRCAPLSMRPR